MNEVLPLFTSEATVVPLMETLVLNGSPSGSVGCMNVTFSLPLVMLFPSTTGKMKCPPVGGLLIVTCQHVV